MFAKCSHARAVGEVRAEGVRDPDADTNRRVARKLREIAGLLEEQDGNAFRVAAYLRAADTVDGLDRDLREVAARQGSRGLMALPGIGRSIAGTIQEILITGDCDVLGRLRGSPGAERVLRRVPGIGPELARRIHEELGIDSIEALEMAAHDGRLAAVPGMGARRMRMVRSALRDMLRHRRPRRRPAEEPDVSLLLQLDREYREAAAAGRLPTIAPRRFNPSGAAWLPVMHVQRAGWAFTVLYSNTPRAHELGRTRDWVVIYFHADDRDEGQRTVVTETRGPHAGRRVVRGREGECYAAATAA